MFVIWIGSIIIILAELFEPSEDMKWAIYAAIAFIISFSFPFTGIGLTKETQTYTIQIKDFSGDYYIKEYEIPKNSNFYLGSTGRYGGNTMLRYKTYPFAGKILEHNVQSYKIINIE